MSKTPERVGVYVDPNIVLNMLANKIAKSEGDKKRAFKEAQDEVLKMQFVQAEEVCVSYWDIIDGHEYFYCAHCGRKMESNCATMQDAQDMLDVGFLDRCPYCGAFMNDAEIWRPWHHKKKEGQ